MTEGLFTLLGVIVGGIVTYASQHALDTRRATREEAAADAASERATRRAARLVLWELLEVITYMNGTLESNGWLADVRLPHEAWLQEQGRLSGFLDDAEWRMVATAYMAVAAWNSLAAASHRANPLRGIDRTIKLDPNATGGLVAVRRRLLPGAGRAAEALRPVALPSAGRDEDLAQFFQRAMAHDDARATSEPTP
jgi:hypothetical protein